MSHRQVIIEQPHWLESWLHHQPAPQDDRGRLGEVLALADENVQRQTGGPFAAAVYDLISGERLSAAVNTVVRNCTALAHAETVALALAQQRLHHHTLHFEQGPDALLVTSSVPCTMCLGAIAWSGITRMVYSTTRGDVEKIGFDEGPPSPRWRAELVRRGVQVRGPLLRRRGQKILEKYASLGSPVYNGRAPDNRPLS